MTDLEKLKSICAEIDTLIEMKVDSSSPQFVAWHNKAERFLIQKFGQGSFEHKAFEGQIFSLIAFAMSTPDEEFVKACSRGLTVTKGVFQNYIEEMETELQSMDGSSIISSHNQLDRKKVFIIHGHNGELKESVARLIEKQGIEAIILHEQANTGATVIEKFERFKHVGAAIALFTCDDEGKASDETEYHSRARQNVIFETGYFMGLLGRQNTILIAEKDVEIPSDLSGVVYVNERNWQVSVLTELKTMGYSIDLNKLLI